MAVLITGGAGFIGLALAERLIASGHGVVLFDLAPPAAALLARPELHGVACVAGDVRSRADLDAAFGVRAIDAVVHAAAVTPNEARERAHAGTIVSVNVGGTVNVMESVCARPGVSRVVVVSSVAVYGIPEPAVSGLLDEESSPAPAALYGITKLAGEQAALRIGELHGRDVRVARLGPVYGRWEVTTGARDALSPHGQVLQAARAGRPVVLPRAMRADWVYSRDVADGIARLCATPDLHHRIYNVGGGGVSDVVEWCRLVAAQMPAFRWALAGPGEPAGIVYNLPADRAALRIDRLRQDTGFAAAYAPPAALGDYLAWMGPTAAGERP